VYESDADHVIGVIYVKDLIKSLSNPREQHTIRSLTREVLLVPDSLPVDNLLARFRSKRQQIAIVLDEFGGTAGLVTLQDIIEEIVGELADQFDRSEPPDVQRLADGSALLSGLTLLAEINDQFGLHIVDENYDTLGGHIMGRLERIPEVGDRIAVDGVTLRIEAMDGMRVDRVSLRPTRPIPEPARSAAAAASTKIGGK
jgi:CBS domain containing-hemolysin-like protein